MQKDDIDIILKESLKSDVNIQFSDNTQLKRDLREKYSTVQDKKWYIPIIIAISMYILLIITFKVISFDGYFINKVIDEIIRFVKSLVILVSILSIYWHGNFNERTGVEV